MDRMQTVTTVWPAHQPYLAPIVAAAYLSFTPLLAVLLSKRWPKSWRAFRDMSIVKLLVLLVMLDSFVFLWASAIIVLGVGTSFSEVACAVGIWWCIALYASSKVAIYLFLSEVSSSHPDCSTVLILPTVERVHLVYAQTVAARHSRFKSPWYRASCFFFMLWIGVAVCMIVGRISHRRPSDGACIIGLKLYATVPMLAVDFAVNAFLTAAFIIPIYRSKFVKARKLARNSAIGAVAALVTSTANILVLALQDGHQLSWVCLGSCGLDVALNACIIFVITAGDRRHEDSFEFSSNVATASRRRTSGFPTAGLHSVTGVGGQGGVTVCSEIVQHEEQGEGPYVPTKQGWRGSPAHAGLRVQGFDVTAIPGLAFASLSKDESDIAVIPTLSPADSEKSSEDEKGHFSPGAFGSTVTTPLVPPTPQTPLSPPPPLTPLSPSFSEKR
ncbi:hypothetical protein OIV83_002450 [Microbotryomycetes sp. JL201]|nr:hypothetical protein OIV83_002450 [Microbotryomycetes sp. JL201]